MQPDQVRVTNLNPPGDVPVKLTITATADVTKAADIKKDDDDG
jgi:hypothetical protein